MEDVQLQGYKLHLDSCVDNPDLGLARVAVYTHDSLRVKRRSDLEDDTLAAIWLECGLPNQHSILVCVGYRQWQLPGQQDRTSASTAEQLSRWLVFLEKWENALSENKEVIVTLDANLDFLTWRQEGLPAHHSSVKLNITPWSHRSYQVPERTAMYWLRSLVLKQTRKALFCTNSFYRNVRPQNDQIYKVF